MPYCPKCRNRVAVTVQMLVSGWLNVEDDIDSYPEVEGQCGELPAKAECQGDTGEPDYTMCGHRGPLSEFKVPDHAMTDHERARSGD